MSSVRNMLLAAGALCVQANCATAQVAVAEFMRVAWGHACIDVPPGYSDYCNGYFESYHTEDDWTVARSDGPSASNETGFATAYYIIAQSGQIKSNKFQLSGRTNAFVNSGGSCSSSSDVLSGCEIVFQVAKRTKATLSGSNSGNGTSYSVQLSRNGGAVLYSTTVTHAPADIVLLPGTYKYAVESKVAPSCAGSCLHDYNDTWNADAAFALVPCDADLNGDDVVEDADFVIFVAAYDELLCPEAPAACPADFNQDGFVDDSDFVFFVAQYNELVCP